jgi:adenylate cyclase
MDPDAKMPLHHVARLLEIARWIVDSALDGTALPDLVAGVAERLVAAGLPFYRVGLAFRILHPLFSGISITWTEGRGATTTFNPAGDAPETPFGRSPFFYLLREQLLEHRWRLEGDTIGRFPIFAELAAAGVTDYVGLVIRFGTVPIDGPAAGIVSSWATRAPAGFDDHQVAALRWILRPLALAMRVSINDQIARTALETFHGSLVGNRILGGAIKRGAGESLRTVIWYSDLRNSTGLAESLPIEQFLGLLNLYCECTAGAILDGGGQVLEIIGDAVLGVFPVLDAIDDATACTQALTAARDAHRRLGALRAEAHPAADAVRFGIGLHLGEVIFGNVGTVGRLNFGLVGRAVNEAARTESMTKILGRPVLVTDAVARLARVPLDDLWALPLPG